MALRTLAVLFLAVTPLALIAQTSPGGAAPPKTWVDKDTGHRVWRLSDEPNSGGFYFNINAYSPDQKQMIYTAPDGIHVLDLATRQTKLLVPNPPRPGSAGQAGAPRPGSGSASGPGAGFPARMPRYSSLPQRAAWPWGTCFRPRKIARRVG